MVKLGKALFYRHTGKLFDGIIYYHQIDIAPGEENFELVRLVRKIAPDLTLPQRGSKPLRDQFMYRFNLNHEFLTMEIVVRFSVQFAFYIVALSREVYGDLVRSQAERGEPALTDGVVHAPLKHRPSNGGV